MQDKWEAAGKYRIESLEVYEHYNGEVCLGSVPLHDSLARNFFNEEKLQKL